MNRKLLYLTTIILTLAGCASEDYVGNEELHEANENGRPVSFDLTSAPQTRSERYGAEAASDLNKHFVVWGEKTMSDNSKQTVFDNYQVNYITNSANTTTSNSAGWEYVGYTSKKSVEQTIKYWDFSADNYNFFAYSLGKGVEVTPATDPITYTYATSSEMTSTGYTLSGSVDELAACYISDKVIKTNTSATNTQVSLKFRRLGAKVKIALYETIPGYSVKDVKFYQSPSATTPGTVAYLYAADGNTAFNRSDGTFTITFAGDGSPLLGWPANNAADLNYISFGNSADWTTWREKENIEKDENVYVGRSSTQATGPSDFKTILPYTAGTSLALKVDYTLLSRDDSKEEIYVKGATATVPAQFAAWKPNCAYTYLFKISDNTDGHIGGVQGLYPITLDAIYVNAEGQQETITTVTEPSITTYQQGADHVAADGEYVAGKPIYIVVYDGTEVADLTGAEVTLYTATIDDGATMTITEATVAKALKDGTQGPTGTWTLTETGSGKHLVVTKVGTEDPDKLQNFTNEVPAEATPDNKAITFGANKVATFTPAVVSGDKYYVFRYKRPAVATPARDAADQFKVIKVKAVTP